jgi:hypothetical protein
LFIDSAIKKKEAILFWTNSALALSAAALTLIGTTAAMAETIVVRSNGPSAKSYPPGKALADKSVVALKAGDSVTILDGRGTRVLKGPGNFSTTASSAAAGSSFGQLLRNTGARQARTGAVRGTGATGPARSPNLWFVDVSKSGTICLADTSTISLWRAGAATAQPLSLTRVSDGKSVAVDFRAGQSVRAWPVADLPAADGAQFRLSGPGMAAPATIKIAALGPNPQGLDGTASALIRKGCNAQLDLLIETVALPSGEAAPTG